jgi:YD repeat-containing protein
LRVQVVLTLTPAHPPPQTRPRFVLVRDDAASTTTKPCSNSMAGSSLAVVNQRGAQHQVATETDPGGVTTTAYDQDGRVCWTLRAPAAVTDPSCASPPSGARVENGYLATTTAPTSVTDPTGKTTTYKYTDHYFPTKPTFVTDPMHKAVVSTSYNEFGDACVTGPVSHPATTCNWAAGDTMEAMDALGQLTTQKDPTGVVTSSTYATATYPTEPTQVAYAGKTTTYAYDKDGRRVKVTEPGGTVVMTAYSADSQACWSGPTTASSVTCTSPLSYGDSTYAHDAGGRLTQMATDTGSTVTFAYTYDASGKLTETTKNGALTVGYAYNAAGEASCVAYPLKPTSSCSGAPGATNTVVDRTYDAAGQLTSVTDWLGNTTSFSSYTPQGQVGAVSYPTSTAESVAYSYDPSGSLTKAAYAGPVVGSKNDTFSYNTDGLLKQETLLGSFSAPTDTYNSYAQVTKATDPTGSGAAQDAYKVTPDGKLSSITPATGTATSFGYNATQELTSRVVGTTTTHFGYDPNGERCWKSATATASTCASAPSHATDYGWNALGELCWSGTSNSTTPCTRPQSADTSYTYGGNGLRLTETDPGTSTTPHRQFSWDTVSGGGTPLVISDGTSAYIYGPSMFGGSAPVEQITTGRPPSSPLSHRASSSPSPRPGASSSRRRTRPSVSRRSPWGPPTSPRSGSRAATPTPRASSTS